MKNEKKIELHTYNEKKDLISLHFRLPPQLGFESKQRQIQLAHGGKAVKL